MKNQDDHFMEVAIKEAEAAEQAGNLPIGAVIVLDGKIISRGRNGIFQPTFRPLHHAEILALEGLDHSHLEQRSKDMTLYTNIEPCVMCLGAAVIHRIGRIVFGAHDPNRGAGYLRKDLEQIYPVDRLPIITGPIMEERCSLMFAQADRVYRARRDPEGILSSPKF